MNAGQQQIPIANLYYLLCYAWDVLPEAEVVAVSALPEMRLQDLLARVLGTAVGRLLRRGLDRAYVSEADEIAGVRGRLDLSTSLKQASFARARAWCTFDELSPDVPHNRIVKTTLRRLAQAEGLQHHLADELRELYRRMPGVQETRLTNRSFGATTLGRNNSAYRLLLDVCEIVHRNLLVDETEGHARFRDFTRDDQQMARLFERFLFHFYSREQARYPRVSTPRFVWRADGEAQQLAYLPGMRTDVVLSSDDSLVVIDAKYYSQTLGEHFTKLSIHSAHLYQIFAYMSHLAAPGHRPRVRGILLYPRTTKTVQVRVTLYEHPFLAATIDLAKDWSCIKSDLLSLVS